MVLALAACAISTAAIAQDQQSRALDALRGVPGSNPLLFRHEPKSDITNGFEKDRWMSDVEALLVAKAKQMPPPVGVRAGAKLALCFKTDAKGTPFAMRLCGGAKNQPLETFVRAALAAAAPLPAPPVADVNKELDWVYSFKR